MKARLETEKTASNTDDNHGNDDDNGASDPSAQTSSPPPAQPQPPQQQQVVSQTQHASPTQIALDAAKDAQIESLTEKVKDLTKIIENLTEKKAEIAGFEKRATRCAS